MHPFLSSSKRRTLALAHAMHACEFMTCSQCGMFTTLISVSRIIGPGRNVHNPSSPSSDADVPLRNRRRGKGRDEGRTDDRFCPIESHPKPTRSVPREQGWTDEPQGDTALFGKGRSILKGGLGAYDSQPRLEQRFDDEIGGTESTENGSEWIHGQKTTRIPTNVGSISLEEECVHHECFP